MLIANNSNSYDEKLNSHDDLPLKKTLKLRNIVTVVTAVFHEGIKYYPHVFIDECLCKL